MKALSNENKQSIDWRIFELQSRLICFRSSRSEIADHKFSSEDGNAFEKLVNESLEWFQSQHYDEVVEERTNEGVCGFPNCGEHLGSAHRSTKYRVDSSNKRIYETNSSARYCSSNCFEKSSILRSKYSECSPYSRNCAMDLSKRDLVDDSIDAVLGLMKVSVPFFPPNYKSDLLEEGTGSLKKNTEYDFKIPSIIKAHDTVTEVDKSREVASGASQLPQAEEQKYIR